MHVEPELHLSADPIRLRQAVSNLVVNALQHTPAGGRIDLEARRAGASVSIEVRDSGRGFGAERVDGSSGTGLGLAIVQAIVRGHGGVVEIDAAGAGGLVTIVLPGPIEGVRPTPLLTIPPSDDQPRPSGVQCAVAVVRKRSVSMKRTPRSFAVSVVSAVMVMTFVQSAAADPSVFHDRLLVSNPTNGTPRILDGGRQDGVKAFAQIGNTMYVGGNFTQVSESSGPTITRNHIFAFDVNTRRDQQQLRAAAQRQGRIDPTGARRSLGVRRWLLHDRQRADREADREDQHVERPARRGLERERQHRLARDGHVDRRQPAVHRRTVHEGQQPDPHEPGGARRLDRCARRLR